MSAVGIHHGVHPSFDKSEDIRLRPSAHNCISILIDATIAGAHENGTSGYSQALCLKFKTLDADLRKELATKRHLCCIRVNLWRFSV